MNIYFGAAAAAAVVLLNFLIMLPYEVRDNGTCLFVVSPTDWNDGDTLPCGAWAVGSVPWDVYHAR
jgi:hypothetical protein